MQQPHDSSSPQATRAFRPRAQSADHAAGQGPAIIATDERRHTASDDLKLVTAADLNHDDLTGFCISNYKLGQRVGGGGMGQVFFAHHATLGKPFAIKFMTDEVRNCTEGGQRFQQEVASLGQLRHPNIVSAVDAGTAGTLQYLVTELIEGTDLSQLVHRDGALRETQARDIIIQAARGLSHAHQLGFVHRDIKPSNLILDKHGVVRLLDFGLVRNQSGTDDLTSPGQLLGTVDFLSPEQAADGRIADHRSDLYGLGCTLLFLLTGHTPFYGDQYSSMASRIHGHLFAEPTALKLLSPNITANLRQCLSRLLAKNPHDRFQSADEFIAALNGSTTPLMAAAKPTMPAHRWISIAVMSGLAACAAFFSIAEIGRRYGSDQKPDAYLTSVAMTQADAPPQIAAPAENVASEEMPSTNTPSQNDSGSATTEPSDTPASPPEPPVDPEPDQRPKPDVPSDAAKGPIDWAASNEKFLNNLPVKPVPRDRSQLLNSHPKLGGFTKD